MDDVVVPWAFGGIQMAHGHSLTHSLTHSILINLFIKYVWRILEGTGEA